MKLFEPLIKQHRQQKLVQCAAHHLFDVVADVNSYKTFLPYCQYSKIVHQELPQMKADLTIGYRYFTETYRSQILLNRPESISIQSIKSSTFTALNSNWVFTPGPTKTSCFVDFQVYFEVSSVLHAHAINLFFNNVVQEQMTAFIEQTQKLYYPIDRIRALYTANSSELWTILCQEPSSAFDFFRKNQSQKIKWLNMIEGSTKEENVLGFCLLLQGSFAERTDFYFRAMDSRNKGVIQRNELLNAFQVRSRIMKKILSRNTVDGTQVSLLVNQIFQQADLDQSGTISYPEWQWIVQIHPELITF